MIIHRTLRTIAIAACLAAAPVAVAPLSQAASRLDQYLGAASEQFATPEDALDALKTRLAADDFAGVAKLLGLDPSKLAKADGIKENYAAIRERAAKLFDVEDDGDERIVLLGDEVWPFPFPLRKRKDGSWAFDTKAGVQEILNRRVGENELEAIATARAYVDAQQDYFSEDHDGDGVMEYAQKLISSEGQTDGLYWPTEQGDGESPAGAFVSEQELQKTKERGEGYFGYRFRILRGQGNSVAGGRYDYVINGNMIAGFGLIAWPVHYAETGVDTFVVNQAGIVYQKDLGPNTESAAAGIARFNPDVTWEIVKE